MLANFPAWVRTACVFLVTAIHLNRVRILTCISRDDIHVSMSCHRLCCVCNIIRNLVKISSSNSLLHIRWHLASAKHTQLIPRPQHKCRLYSHIVTFIGSEMEIIFSSSNLKEALGSSKCMLVSLLHSWISSRIFVVETGGDLVECQRVLAVMLCSCSFNGLPRLRRG